ncbi:hypothetical protein NDU88_006740 [Pleurodeles waltl]|uniref:Uncharacterized protein n=1 Tax=Pleurodeles waltl TaxID=8319 RepID=A0AAV7ULW3_PLEWA|nr:hypothetical protein NDU88_006740 [Pleurodeles waltl]
MQPETSALIRRWSRGRISHDTAPGSAADPSSGTRSRGQSAASHSERAGRRRGHSNSAGRPPPPKRPRTSLCSYSCQRRSRAAGWAT